MEQIDDVDVVKNVNYLPHQCVIKTDNLTTKTRVILNGFAEN